MSHHNSGSNREVSESILEDLHALDDEDLRDVINFAQNLLSERVPLTSQIEAGPGEEIISISHQDGYTLVTKTHECAEGCEDCPHGPYLYRVSEERRPENMESTLHWVFLGLVSSSEPE